MLQSLLFIVVCVLPAPTMKSEKRDRKQDLVRSYTQRQSSSQATSSEKTAAPERLVNPPPDVKNIKRHNCTKVSHWRRLNPVYQRLQEVCFGEGSWFVAHSFADCAAVCLDEHKGKTLHEVRHEVVGKYIERKAQLGKLFKVKESEMEWSALRSCASKVIRRHRGDAEGPLGC